MDAILLRKLPEGISGVYVWKKYEVNSSTKYTWDRWRAVSTTTYKWNKYGTKTGIIEQLHNSTNSTELSYSRISSKWQLPLSVYDDYRVDNASNSFAKDRNYEPPQWCVYKNASTFWTWVYEGITEGAYISDYCIPYAGGFDHSTVYFRGFSKGFTVEKIISYEDDAPHARLRASSYYTYEDGQVKDSGNSYGQVSSTSASAYPSNGVSGSYWYESAGSSTSWSKGSTSYGTVSSTNSSAYPNGGRSGFYWFENRQQIITHSMGTYIEDVFSTNPKRYPENGIDGSYWYVLQS